jgi:hypothetical protein
MTTLPRLLIVTIGRGAAPSSWSRVYQLLDEVRQRFEVIDLVNWPHAAPAAQRATDFARVLDGAARADVVLIHRVLLEVEQLNRLRATGKPLVFDFDDAIYAVPSSAWRAESGMPIGVLKRLRRRLLHGRSDYSSRKSLLDRTLRQMTAVSAGNDHLARYAAQFCTRVAIVPTILDVARLPIKQHQDGPRCVVGWQGTADNLYYLASIAPALRELSARPNFELTVVSGQEFAAPGVTVVNHRWSRETEVHDMLTFDVGIMPLTDDEWARGKSGNKAIYYMALGMPAVVSPVGVNREIVEHGHTGYHARTTGEWVAALARLVEDADMRREMGSRARRYVEQYYSKDAAVEKLATVLNEACRAGVSQ